MRGLRGGCKVSNPGQQPPIRQLILEVLAECGAVGVLSPEIAILHNRRGDTVSTAMSRLTDAGLVGWRLDPVSRTHNRRRYWLIQHMPAKAPAPTRTRFDTPKRPAATASAYAVHVRADGVKVTRAALNRYDPRYQVQPGVLVRGEFSALRPGQYLDGVAA